LLLYAVYAIGLELAASCCRSLGLGLAAARTRQSGFPSPWRCSHSSCCCSHRNDRPLWTTHWLVRLRWAGCESASLYRYCMRSLSLFLHAPHPAGPALADTPRTAGCARVVAVAHAGNEHNSLNSHHTGHGSAFDARRESAALARPAPRTRTTASRKSW
jgi:hypothetical protein